MRRSCVGAAAMCKGAPQNTAYVLQRVGLLGLLIGPPAKHAWKAEGNSGTVPARGGNPLEPEFEDVHRLDVPNGAEPLARVTTDPFIHLSDLLVRQPRVRLRDRHQLPVLPYAERVIGQQARPASTPRLRVDQN